MAIVYHLDKWNTWFSAYLLQVARPLNTYADTLLLRTCCRTIASSYTTMEHNDNVMAMAERWWCASHHSYLHDNYSKRYLEVWITCYIHDHIFRSFSHDLSINIKLEQIMSTLHKGGWKNEPTLHLMFFYSHFTGFHIDTSTLLEVHESMKTWYSKYFFEQQNF